MPLKRLKSEIRATNKKVNENDDLRFLWTRQSKQNQSIKYTLKNSN